ncbi:hypothetical protein [Mangrovibacterium diazotrophicum]|uniref:Lipoprotein n=1 Tax=Mangrovibacterium diazotrophicum TaxID=1261403 RepID=A0A419VU67_9BACT|nr:hypothetical protein [Mangrovibacterium diazotrophicum]RKD85039.1 hypothetical protein BC643_4558 [Mangrovibacterium diazotrophicum]
MTQKLFQVIVIILIASSCDYYDNRLVIANKTDKPICYDYDLDTILDVSSTNRKDYILNNSIQPNETRSISIPGSTDMWIRKIYQSKDTTMSFYIFDYETVLLSDWDSLRLNNGYVKRLDYELVELEKIDWKIEIK